MVLKLLTLRFAYAQNEIFLETPNHDTTPANSGRRTANKQIDKRLDDATRLFLRKKEAKEGSAHASEARHTCILIIL